MFTTGIALFIYDFVKYGIPTDEALEGGNNETTSFPEIKIGANHVSNKKGVLSEK
jgi:nitric oxide reductase subunit B